ncbi:MAG: hypothetical protein FJX74_00470 [Armatimonadetes bacterium]|nr:hypothetical protein [Armatimonadota bacterium]
MPTPVLVGGFASLLAAVQAQPAASWWDAPDRGREVAELIPGRRIPPVTAETLFAEWTVAQVERWERDHAAPAAAEAFAQHAAVAPTDAELRADFPRHIAPFARVRTGSPEAFKVEGALISYCVFCSSRAFSLAYDADNPYHATTTCCRTELYGREADFPPDYSLRPTESVSFPHLDDTSVDVPGTLYRDAEGVEWELFIRTIFDQQRWLSIGCDLVKQYALKFRETADPLYAHKIAILLDLAADTYYGLPLCWHNEVCNGRDGLPLGRAEWEAVPRPAIFEVSYLGPWSRRTPLGSKGWLNMFDEQIWVEPFALVRHHPAFREVSRQLHGDPDALDQKVREKLLREVALMFKSVFSQKLLTNYQEANYVEMWLLGVLLQDAELIDFAGPAQEVTLYNHSYQDGLNGEGAPNYMAMPGGYFYPYLRDPEGWLRFYPRFLEDNPFYFAADGELRKLTTVRGVQLEFGDQHEHAFPPGFLTDPAAVRENERLGSRNWAGYGVGILRVGGPGHRQEVSLSYTRATLHNAQDALSLECWVDGVPVMRRGGYAAHWCNAHLQWERPEFAALKAMAYPHEIAEAAEGFSSWSWVYAHSPLCQNGVTVDGVATGRGWADNRGYGEVITFKGGETAGEPGAGFQVLDVRDHYSWARMDKDVSDFRRTLIGVEGPDGRPYVLDLLKLTGGERHALYNSAWAQRAEANLPVVQADAETLAQVVLPTDAPADDPEHEHFRRVRNVERLAAPSEPWDLTWQTDMAAYAPRDPDGKPFRRPLPEDTGRVRLRLLGLPQSEGRTELLRAQGPWIGWMRQPLPGGHRVDGNVAFLNARDFLVESRTAEAGQPLGSLFIHLLEGYREGEESAIRSITRLEPTGAEGPARDIVALRLEMVGGHADTVIYQSEAGSLTLPDGLQTDARYALIRRDAAGAVIAADAARGSSLTLDGFRVSLPGDFTGEIVDVVGDLTGTRAESALIVRPDKPWPSGEHLVGRQLLIRVESDLREPCNEGYRIAGISALPGGLVRVEVQDHAPFATSWHQVTVLSPDRPNVIRTWRPMVDHGNTPWYCGLKLWFPERDRTYTIRQVNEVGGGYGGDTVELVEEVDLAAEGIQVGDWYVIYGIRPGLQVTVANDFSWRSEPAPDRQQHVLRATGEVTVECSATAAALDWLAGDGAWRAAPRGKPSFAAEETGGRLVRLISGKPPWLRLADTSAPAITRLALDDRELSPEQAADLGWIEPPRSLAIDWNDADNPLDPESLALTLNGARLDADLLSATPGGDGQSLALRVDLARALAPFAAQPRRHRIEATVADRSVERRSTTVGVSFMVRTETDPNALYLSDLQPVSSFAHGGLIRDRDYVGNPAEIVDRFYPKCLTLCPEPSPDGTHGEVIYALPADRGALVLHSDIGISSSARGNGSAAFLVQIGAAAEGPWQTLYESPILRGGQEPLTLSVPLGGATHLRLYTTDATDGINSDHAVWGAARLAP